MEADLLQAAFSKVKAIADNLHLPCYWPNVALPTPPANVHLRASVISTRPRVIGTCGKARSRWSLQIAVWVRDGVGVITPANTGDAIAAGLPLGLVIAGASRTHTITGLYSWLWRERTGASRTYTITEPAEPVAPVRADGWYATPYLFALEHID